MFAVFYNGVFNDWWLNEADDKTWVERACLAMGWNKLNVLVVKHDFRPGQGKPFIFSEDCMTLITLKKTQVEVDGKMVDSWNNDETWQGTVWFQNGALQAQ